MTWVPVGFKTEGRCISPWLGSGLWAGGEEEVGAPAVPAAPLRRHFTPCPLWVRWESPSSSCLEGTVGGAQAAFGAVPEARQLTARAVPGWIPCT